MVSTVALAAISESTLSSMQTLSVKGYESGHHRLYSSCGMPKGAHRRQDYVYAEGAPGLTTYLRQAISNQIQPN